MCPVLTLKFLVRFVLLFLFFLWAVGIPLYLIARMEKIIRLLEKKDQK